MLRAGAPGDGRHLRRANSALAMGDPGVPLPEALDRVLEFSARHERPPLAVVELGSDTEQALASLGWAATDLAPVHTQLAPVARTLRGLGGAPDDAWLAEDGDRVEVRLGGLARGRAARRG